MNRSSSFNQFLLLINHLQAARNLPPFRPLRTIPANRLKSQGFLPKHHSAKAKRRTRAKVSTRSRSPFDTTHTTAKIAVSKPPPMSFPGCMRTIAFHIALTLVALQASAASDPLIQAGELALLARERARLCRFHDASALLHLAIRETRAAPGDTSATLRARLLAGKLDLKQQSTHARSLVRDTRRFLAAAQAESAAELWLGSGAEACAPGLQADIARRRVAARDWIVLGRSARDPQTALRHFRNAAALNAQSPGLAAAIEQARRSSPRRGRARCATAAKVLLSVFAVAAMGAAGYYTYQTRTHAESALRPAAPR